MAGATSAAAAARLAATGLFGLPWLRRPTDLVQRASIVQARCAALAQQVATRPPGLGTLHALDDISAALCGIVDSAAALRAVHPDPAWVAAADDTVTVVLSAMARLNTDRALYDALRCAHRASAASGLSEEQERFAELLGAQFEADGVHLPPDRQAHVHELQDRVVALSTAFMAEATAPAPPPSPPAGVAGWDGDASAGAGGRPMVGAGGPDAQSVWVPERRVAGLPAQVLASLPRAAPPAGAGCSEVLVHIPSDPTAAAACLTWCPDEEVRRAALFARDSRAPHNLATLQDLVGARRALAQALGFESHTRMALAQGRMARSEAQVAALLDTVGRRIAPRVGAEHERLRLEKVRLAAAGALGARTSCGDAGSLAAWDVSFLTSRLKAEACAADLGEVSQYLDLDSCLSGLSTTLKKLLGVALVEVAPRPGEQWHAEARKFAVVDAEGAGGRSPEEAALGIIFMDLHAREGKSPAPATYTLNSGRLARPAHSWPATGDATAGPADEHPVGVPVVLVSCSFAAPRQPGALTAPPSTASSGAATCGNGTCLLGHGDLVTLYHEMGHALHAALSRTEFQHLSGVRGPLDFVELPPLLFERLAWDWRSLRGWATHVRTGARLPRDLIEALRKSDGMFAGHYTAAQVLYSRVDLALHCAAPLPPGGTTPLVRQAHATAFGPGLPFPEGTHWEAHFGHFVGYASGYYSYLLCKAMSAQIWRARFAADPTARPAGDALRNAVLRHGNARDPAAMFAEAVGGGHAVATPFDLEPFLEEVTGEVVGN